MRSTSTLLSLMLLAGAAAPATARAGDGDDAKAAADKPTCPTGGAFKKVYAIGSSTMGMTLGDILKDELGARGAEVRVWGKASSGLARPDFHDWPTEAVGLMERHRPDAVIVSLGTNDGQNLWHEGRWHEFGGRIWKRIYAARVDALLATLSGSDKARPVIWIGPTVLPQATANDRMKVISEIIAARIAACGGSVRFVDGLAQTTDGSGAIRRAVQPPGGKKTLKARAPDDVHLTRAGVRWLLAEPVLEALRPCFDRRATEARSGQRPPG